jgi:hypothetical protein
MGPGALASGGDPNSADDADDHFNDGISSIPYHFTPSIAFLKETVCLLGIPPGPDHLWPWLYLHFFCCYKL